jgi:hypothetical protein
MSNEHNRGLDHYGVEEVSTSVLDAAVGRYAAGTDLQTVLADLINRLDFIETASGTTGSFSGDAVIVAFLGSFTADAFIQPSFTADAFIVG